MNPGLNPAGRVGRRWQQVKHRVGLSGVTELNRRVEVVSEGLAENAVLAVALERRLTVLERTVVVRADQRLGPAQRSE